MATASTRRASPCAMSLARARTILPACRRPGAPCHLAREDQPTFERDGRRRDDPVTAHRWIARGVHQHDACMCLRRQRLGQATRRSCRHGPRGGSTTRSSECVRVLPEPVTLMRQRSTMWTWEPFDDEPERLTSRMSVDSLDEADHKARLTRSLEGTIARSFSANRTHSVSQRGVSFALWFCASAFGERPWGIGTGGCS